jgi:hypothetical protein
MITKVEGVELQLVNQHDDDNNNINEAESILYTFPTLSTTDQSSIESCLHQLKSLYDDDDDDDDQEFPSNIGFHNLSLFRITDSSKSNRLNKITKYDVLKNLNGNIAPGRMTLLLAHQVVVDQYL